jgi:hypothetical protein
MKSASDSPAREQLNDEHNHGDDQNEVDQPARYVKTESEEPKDEENDDERVKHRKVSGFPLIRI